jgi:hypothetical protein
MERRDEDVSTRDIAGARSATETEPETRTGERMMPEGSEQAEDREADMSTGTMTGGGTADADTDTDTGPLLDDTDQTDFQGRWAEIQTRFVDDPRSAVEDADELVAAVMKRLADGFADERERLETVWSRGEDVGTEDLRVALQRYRAFFHRLLST